MSFLKLTSITTVDFSYSLNKNSLSAYSVPVATPGAGDAAVIKVEQILILQNIE